MSRRKSRSAAQGARLNAPAQPSIGPLDGGTREFLDLQRAAIERRQARMAERSAAVGIVANDPDELHRRAVELREYRMGRGPRPAGMDVPRSIVTEDGTISVTLPVMGMTCRACEVRIARHVGRLPGVSRVTASAAHGRVVVESSAPVSPAWIEKAINKAGYEIGGTPWLERDPKIWMTAAGGVLLVAAIAVIAQATGVADLASGTGDLGNGGLPVALLLGLAAGVSTCMALVGGLVLALSAAYQARRAAADSPSEGLGAQMRPALVFVGGRIAGYGVLGAGLGAIGAGMTMPPQVTAVLMIAVAIVMTLLGTRLTGLSPRLAGWSPTLPMGLGARLGLREGSVDSYSDGRAAALGAATFFLPCGFTQAVQIYALSTGSPLFAGAIMAVFAIGTAPGLLALAGLPVVVPSRARPTLLRLVGVVVIGFALVNASSGIRLSGWTLPSLGVGPVVAAQPPGDVAADGTQSLTTYQDAFGYSPGNVAIYAGFPTRWTIESSTAKTCASFLVVPSLGIQVILREGSNVIDLPALRPGTLAYACSMGMYGGRITVVERPAQPAGDASGG